MSELVTLKSGRNDTPAKPYDPAEPVIHLTGPTGQAVHLSKPSIQAVVQVEREAPAYDAGARSAVIAAGQQFVVQESHTEVCRQLGWADA